MGAVYTSMELCIALDELIFTKDAIVVLVKGFENLCQLRFFLLIRKLGCEEGHNCLLEF
jgi:hypothetical protein